MRYLRFYVNLFLAAGVPFGIVTGTVFSFAEFPLGLAAGLLAGVAFGLVMSLLCGSLHLVKAKRVARGDLAAALCVHHLRNIEIGLPYDEVFDRCINSLRGIRKVRLYRSDPVGGTIEARTGMTWTRCAAAINLTLRKINDQRTEVKISSRPVLPTTLIDFGENLQNVETIVALLKEPSTAAEA